MKFNGIEHAGQHNTGLTMHLDETIKIPSACTPTPDRGIAVGMTGVCTVGKSPAQPVALMGKLETIESDAKGTVFNRGVIVVPWSGPATAYGYMGLVCQNGFALPGTPATGAPKYAMVIGVSGGFATIDLG